MPFNVLKESEFIGRQDELSLLVRTALAADSSAAQSVVLTGPPGIGKSELLKQVFNYVFWKQDRVAPFYSDVNPAFLTAAAFAASYLVRFICQRLAFETKDQTLLSADGLSLDAVASLAEDHNASWAREILDRYEACTHDPVHALRTALEAPYASALASGVPVAVLIDDFHRLSGLQADGPGGPQLISLFETPMQSRKTPHIIAGWSAEILELPVTSGMPRIAVPPLGPEDAASRAAALLRSHDREGAGPPPLLLRHLGGNPFSLECVVRTASRQKQPTEHDYWNAYIQEIMEGRLLFSWTSVLKSVFPNLALRRIAVTITHKINHTAEPLSCQRIAKAFSLTEDKAEAIARLLYLSGFIRGEFGVFRAVEDRVVRDIVDSLYLREILAKPHRDVMQDFQEKLLPGSAESVRYDMVLPMAKEAELVAAQCLDQIAKNLHLDADAIGQLQIALIEACINAIEHSKGTDNKIFVTVQVEGDRLEVSVESAGRDFIVQDTGEPYTGVREVKKGRGWGIKLMKQFADDVRFEKTPRGTRTIIAKKLERAAGMREEDPGDHE